VGVIESRSHPNDKHINFVDFHDNAASIIRVGWFSSRNEVTETTTGSLKGEAVIPILPKIRVAERYTDIIHIQLDSLDRPAHGDQDLLLLISELSIIAHETWQVVDQKDFIIL
jgi:hypothetical protein